MSIPPEGELLLRGLRTLRLGEAKHTCSSPVTLWKSLWPCTDLKCCPILQTYEGRWCRGDFWGTTALKLTLAECADGSGPAVKAAKKCLTHRWYPGTKASAIPIVCCQSWELQNVPGSGLEAYQGRVRAAAVGLHNWQLSLIWNSHFMFGLFSYRPLSLSLWMKVSMCS